MHSAEVHKNHSKQKDNDGNDGDGHMSNGIVFQGTKL